MQTDSKINRKRGTNRKRQQKNRYLEKRKGTREGEKNRKTTIFAKMVHQKTQYFSPRLKYDIFTTKIN